MSHIGATIVSPDLYPTYLDRWLTIVHRHAVATLALACLLTVIAIIYVINGLGINTSTSDMISPEVPFRQNSIAFDQAFPQFDDNIVAVIDAATQEGADIAATQLAQQLAAQPDLFLDISQPGGEQFFRENGLLLLGLEDLYDLADQLAGAEPLLSALGRDTSLRGLTDLLSQALDAGEIAERDSLVQAINAMADVAEAQAQGRPMMLSWAALLGDSESDGAVSAINNEYGHRRFVIVRPALDFASLKPAARAIDAIRASADAVGIGPATNSRVRLTGNTTIEQEELETVELGGQLAGYLSLALVTLLLFVCLRSPMLVVVTVVTLLMGLCWTAALATATVGELNLISVAFAVLFIGLGVDFGIHYTLRYLETDRSDRGQAKAIKDTGGSVGGALSLSAICAAAGFFAFLPTDYDGLAELGFIAGMGMFVALAANLTVLPAWLSLAPSTRQLSNQPAWGVAIARLLERRAKAILTGSAAIFAGCLVLLPAISFDFNPINLRDPNTQSVATFLDLARDPDSSFYAADLLVENVSAVDNVATALTELPAVSRVISITSFVPEDQDEKLFVIDELAFFLTGIVAPAAPAPALGDDERAILLTLFQGELGKHDNRDTDLGRAAQRFNAALDAVGESDATINPADAIELERRLLGYFPHLVDQLTAALNAAPISLDDLPAEIVDQWIATDGQARLLIQPAGGITSNRDVEAFADAVTSIAPSATGTPIIVTEAGRVILRAFLTATVIAFVAIIVILIAVVRRATDILLILGPLLFAAALTIALSVIFSLSFNFANIIVLPLLLGLGIASAIHLVMRWRRAGGDLSVVGSSTPRAVLFSAMTTIAAFGSLAVSGHLGMRSMGVLLAIALAATLIATLLVLPSLLVIVGRRPNNS